MRPRVLASVAVVALALVVGWVALARSARRPAAKQAREGEAQEHKWTPLRTSWNAPDLQGIYNTASGTPLERPNWVKGPVLTDEEFAEAQRRFAEAEARGDSTAPVKEGDANFNAYNNFWRDRAKPSRRSSLIIDPPDGRLPPLAQEGLKRMAARAERFRGVPPDEPAPGGFTEDISNWVRCITRGLPGVMMTNTYNMNLQIVQARGYVMILHEMIHEPRIIPLDGRPHVGSNIRQYYGDPVGHWEGNTLVIDTTNFNDKIDFKGTFTGQGSVTTTTKLHVVERLTRVADGEIEYQYTVDDPGTWTKPWTARWSWTKDDNQDEIYEYGCHEGNRGIVGILTGARVRENAAPLKNR